MLEISIAFVLKLYSLNVIKKSRIESNRELANRNRIQSGHLNRCPALMCIFLSFSFFIAFSIQKHFYFVVPCIKTFHGTSMQCLHQATFKSTYDRFNQGPFIKSVFSAYEEKKAPSENSKARRGCFAKLSAKNYGGGNERVDQQSLWS